MNLLDLATGALEPGAARRDRARPGAQAQARRRRARRRSGVVADYFVKRYGFEPGTPVIAFTGDNPSSLVGMGATAPGTAVVSLGTSDTMFAAMAAPRTDPRGYGNVFGNPAGGFMALCCFANGSLAREEIAQAASTWPGTTSRAPSWSRPSPATAATCCSPTSSPRSPRA